MTQKQRVVSVCTTRKVEGSEIICHEGDYASFLIIVLEGRVNGQGVGTIFNSEYILTVDQNEKIITEKIVQEEEGTIGILYFSTIF